MQPGLTRVIECKLRKIEPRIVAHNGLKCFAVKFSLNCGIFGRCRPRFGGFGGDIDIPKRQKLRARADKLLKDWLFRSKLSFNVPPFRLR